MGLAMERGCKACLLLLAMQEGQGFPQESVGRSDCVLGVSYTMSEP